MWYVPGSMPGRGNYQRYHINRVLLLFTARGAHPDAPFTRPRARCNNPPRINRRVRFILLCCATLNATRAPIAPAAVAVRIRPREIYRCVRLSRESLAIVIRAITLRLTSGQGIIRCAMNHFFVNPRVRVSTVLTPRMCAGRFVPFSFFEIYYEIYLG